MVRFPAAKGCPVGGARRGPGSFVRKIPGFPGLPGAVPRTGCRWAAFGSLRCGGMPVACAEGIPPSLSGWFSMIARHGLDASRSAAGGSRRPRSQRDGVPAYGVFHGRVRAAPGRMGKRKPIGFRAGKAVSPAKSPTSPDQSSMLVPRIANRALIRSALRCMNHLNWAELAARNFTVRMRLYFQNVLSGIFFRGRSAREQGSVMIPLIRLEEFVDESVKRGP